DNVPVLTRDENIVQVEINVQYRVSDPRLFLFGTRDARQVLEQAALSVVREQVGRSSLDTVLGARQALAAAAQSQLQRSLDAYGAGLAV
ncbi:SPFH domain-containing protein, partial [Acinetobacter baumannii]